jgi:hypothetical protein
VIVAVVAVGMVQVTFHQVIHVVAVRNRFVTAIRAVLVVGRVSAAIMLRGAGCGMRGVYRQHVLVHVVAVGMVQVAVMQVVFVVVVLNGGVAAAGAMLVGMLAVLLTIAHGILLGLVALLLPFPGMFKHSVNQLHYVLVRQGIEDVLSLPAGNHQVFRA